MIVLNRLQQLLNVTVFLKYFFIRKKTNHYLLIANYYLLPLHVQKNKVK